ncbi:sialic acid TRAP transporter substrate-binding protein SiaP [Pseudooceanicola sp. C21-150M6]|uniref:sialic acid TRAP transporter substrate-binding protein SiaP n=1 Tax=Pseudooceanicola sp. C21-150M6 TaxID=3434355 RepID=UPI003D7F344B
MLKTLTAAAVSLAALGFTTTAQADNFVFAHILPESHSHHKWTQWAAAQIEERTEGRHTLEIFPGAQLGSETETNEGLALGTVDIIYTGNAFAGRSYGPLAVASAPFVFRDFAHWQAYAASDFFDELADGYQDATGNVPLATIYAGERHVTANKPVTSPDDMKGMKIRVPDAPLLKMFPLAVGANPTPIAFSEVYLALQQGVVDGQENPLPTIKAMKFYEVQSDISLTGHIVDAQLAIISGSAWGSLSEEDQKIFREVFQEACAQGSEDIRQQEADLITWYRDNGVNVNEVDRAPFAEAVKSVINGPDATWTPEQFDALSAIK